MGIYRELLGSVPNIKLNQYSEGIVPNYAYFPILFKTKEERDRIYHKLVENNIYPRRYFYPITADQACFKNKYRNIKLEYARYYADRILVLPLYAELEKIQIEQIVQYIKRNL